MAIRLKKLIINQLIIVKNYKDYFKGVNKLNIKKSILISLVLVLLLLIIGCTKEITNYTVNFKVDGETIQTLTIEEGTPLEMPSDPAKEEHKFLGWYNDNGDLITKGFEVVGNMDLTAKFETIKYTITIDFNDGSGKVLTYNYAAGEVLKKPTMPTKTGYTFAGWYVGDESFSFDRMPNKNINVIAKWTLNETIISFKTDGGSNVSQIIALPGTKIEAPKDPYRKLCKFLGWYDEDGNLFEFDVMPAENITLYAKWEGQTYTITYELNGGTCDNLITTYSSYRNTDIELPRPTKEGYAFMGWYTLASFNRDPFFIITDDINKNLTLYAKWEEVKTKELKTIGIYGDSISTYEGYVPSDALFYYPTASRTVKQAEHTWWRLLQHKVGAELIRNASYSTSPVCGTASLCGVNKGRIKKLINSYGEAPDIIIIMMGANDVVNGFTTEKFGEEYRLMLDRMKEICPNSDVIICNILYNTCTEGQNPDPRYDSMTHPGLRAKLNEELAKIAVEYNYPLVDISSLISEETDTPDNWYYLDDNMHPSALGMELIADAIAEKILEIY